jgi:uncharacterized protein
MPVRTFKRALVTGASTGIGEAIARDLASRGAHLVLVARSRDKLEALASELRDSGPAEVEVLPADLTDREDLDRVAARLRRGDAPVDLLVNNAGVGQVGAFVDLDPEVADRQIRLNAIAPLHLAHALLTRVREQGGGILNVSSIAASQPVPTMATYAATKAFLSSWSQALREELRDDPVHVTLLAPGFTRTPFVDAAEAGSEARWIPGPLWDDPLEVARAGLDGVARDRALVVPGVVYRASVAASDVTPTALTRRIVGTATRLMGRGRGPTAGGGDGH